MRAACMTSSYRAEDFPRAGLDQSGLDAVIGDLPGVVALYPPAPLQEGLLFQDLYAAAERPTARQLLLTGRDTIDEAAFTAAWAYVVRRHDMLRAALPWKGMDRPLWCIQEHVPLAWGRLSWSERLDGRVGKARLDAFMAAERSQGFTFHKAPLMRLTLIRGSGGGWAFIWTFVPLLLDGVSIRRILAEVHDAYEAAVRGRPVHLPSPSGYSDYLTWLSSRSEPGAEAFWRRYLSGCPGPTRLSVDGYESSPRDRSTEPPGVAVREIGRPLMLRLGDFARMQNVAAETVVEGAVALALSRMGGTHDVLFGAVRPLLPPPISGREDPVGLMLTAVPVRARLGPDRIVGQWLRTLERDAGDRARHDQAPLVDIHAWADFAPDQRLFEALLSFEPEPLERFVSDRWTHLEVDRVELVEEPREAISITFEADAEGQLRIRWDEHRLSAVMAKRFSSLLHRVLDSMTLDPNQPLCEVALVGPAEARLVLRSSDGPALGETGPRAVHEYVEAVAFASPNAPAVILDNVAMPYGDLNERANRLARHLVGLGVGPDVVVAVCVQASPALAVALLAGSKAGGGYVALDPGMPTERLAKILDDARPAVVVTHGAVEPHLPALRGMVVRLDRDWPTIGLLDASNLGLRIEPDALAYLAYTSGTTGRPLGVECSHRGLASSLQARLLHYPDSVGALLATLSVSFDAGAAGFWWTMACGGRWTIPNPSVGHDPVGHGDLIRRQGVTHLMLVPSMYRSLLQAAPDSLRSVRSVTVGGEICTSELVQLHHRVLPRTRLVNEYGPTEACVWATAHVCRSDEERIPIGKPIAGVRAYVLDEHRRLVGDGEVGELYVCGPGVARGYRGAPEATRRRFARDPWGSGERMVATGDYVARLISGELVFVGRRDRQVKIRGMRIELDDVEAHLRALPSVHECVVTLWGRGLDARLVAYVVPTLDAKVDERALSRALRQRIPEPMIPSEFVELRRLPRGPGGKLDYGALPRTRVSRETAPPLGARTRLEADLVGLWGELLERDEVAIDDDFFALGGHSILATRLVARLREPPFSVALPLSALFEAPTVEGLAQRIDAARESGNIVVSPTDSRVVASEVDDDVDEDVERMLQELIESEG